MLRSRPKSRAKEEGTPAHLGRARGVEEQGGAASRPARIASDAALPQGGERPLPAGQIQQTLTNSSFARFLGSTTVNHYFILQMLFLWFLNTTLLDFLPFRLFFSAFQGDSLSFNHAFKVDLPQNSTPGPFLPLYHLF